MSILSIWMAYPLFRVVLIINNFSQKSCVTVSYNRKSLFSSYYSNLYLYSGWVSALSRRAAQRRPLAGHRPRPQTEVVILASTAAIWSCVMCRCVNVYTIWGQYHLTIQVKLGCPTDWLNSLNLSTSPPCTVRRAADYAARSPPLGCSLFIF